MTKCVTYPDPTVTGTACKFAIPEFKPNKCILSYFKQANRKFCNE